MSHTGVAPAGVPQLHPPLLACLQSLRKQEMRACKGIKILLAICPSSHRSEGFLPQPEVSWNRRMRCASFLPTLSLLSGSPARWASCHVPSASFSLRSASTAGAFAKVGFCRAWPPPCRGHAEVVSARLNLKNGTMDDGGVCDFLGSVSPQQKFEVMDQTSVIPQFYWQAKENTSSRCEGWLTQKTQRGQKPLAQFWLLFLYIFSPFPEPGLCKLG